jgi:hypothetical protein
MYALGIMTWNTSVLRQCINVNILVRHSEVNFLENIGFLMLESSTDSVTSEK